MIVLRQNNFSWTSEDDEWVGKIKKGASRDKKETRIIGPMVAASSVATPGLGLIRVAHKASKKIAAKGGKGHLIGATALDLGTKALAAGTTIAAGVAGNKEAKKEVKRIDDRANARIRRYKKMDDEHREWVRNNDKDPSKFIDWKYYKNGGYKPYRKNKKENDSTKTE